MHKTGINVFSGYFLRPTIPNMTFIRYNYGCLWLDCNNRVLNVIYEIFYLGQLSQTTENIHV